MSDLTHVPEPLSTSDAALVPEIDTVRQVHARPYARRQRWLSMIDSAIGVLFLGAIFWTRANLRLRDSLSAAGLVRWQPIAGWSPLLVAAIVMLFYTAYVVIVLPLTWYSTFTLPHHYGLSHQPVRNWLADQVKTFVLSGVLIVAVGEVLYLVLALQPLTWWLWLGAGLLVLTVLFANLAPIFLFPLFYKFTPLPEGELRDRLLALAQRANARVRGVYVMNMSSKTEQGNAALMGLGPTRRIVIGDTILKHYTDDEISVILAHELGHHVHRDIVKGIIFTTAVTLGGLALVNLGVQFAVTQAHFGYHGVADVAAFPLFVAVMGAYGLISGPLNNTFSRNIERTADQYALDTTRDPANFISAFKRLANQNLAQVDPGPVIEALFYSHPAISKRLLHAEQWRASHAAEGRQ